MADGDLTVSSSLFFPKQQIKKEQTFDFGFSNIDVWVANATKQYKNVD